MYLVHYTNNSLIGNSKYLDDIKKLKEKYKRLEYFQLQEGIDEYVFNIPITDEELLEIVKNNSIIIM